MLRQIITRLLAVVPILFGLSIFVFLLVHFAPGDVTDALLGPMATEEAKEIYKERASTAECVNAVARNRGLQQFRVRGQRKVKAVLLWYALAHNMMRGLALRFQNMASPDPAMA